MCTMILRLRCFAVGSFVATAAMANSPPEVSNTTAGQRTDGSKLVDIRYNLAGVVSDQDTGAGD